MHHLHRGGGRLLGRALQRGVGAPPVVQAGVDGDAQGQRGDQNDQEPAPALHAGCSEGAGSGAAPRPWSRLNTAGTKTRVATVAQQEPADDRAPERRVLLAALAQPQRHRDHADDHGQRGHQHGTEAGDPRLDGGRRGVAVLGRAAPWRRTPPGCCWRCPTPMHMIAPISAGTLSVVPVRKRNTMMPGEGGGQRRDDDERIEPGLEVHDDQQVDEHDREGEAAEEPEVGGPHGLDLAAQGDEAARAAGAADWRRRCARCRGPPRRGRGPAPSRRCPPPGGCCSARSPPSRWRGRSRPRRPGSGAASLVEPLIGMFWRSWSDWIEYWGAWVTRL